MAKGKRVVRKAQDIERGERGRPKLGSLSINHHFRRAKSEWRQEGAYPQTIPLLSQHLLVYKRGEEKCFPPLPAAI